MNNFGPCTQDCPNRKAGCSASCEAWNAVKGERLKSYGTSADTWRRYDGIAMRDCIGSVVTNWMPLPETPEVNDGKENS